MHASVRDLVIPAQPPFPALSPQGDPQIRRLIRHDPFQRADLNGENEDDPAQPAWIRCLLYEYRFAPFGSGAHWERELVRVYLPPMSSQLAASLLARAGLPTS